MAALAVASLFGATSCGGLGTGDYAVYRVSFEESKKDAACYPNKKIPDSVKDDSSTFQSGNTLILYLTSDTEALLDNGSVVIKGSLADGTFKFSGEDINIDYPGIMANDTTKITATVTVGVEMKVDGAIASGTSTSTIKQTCTGMSCPPDFNLSCTQTAAFKGVQIDSGDIALSPAGGGSGNPTP